LVLLLSCLGPLVVLLSCLGPLVLLLPKLSIIWLYNLSIYSVPDEGYSRNVPCTLNLISTFLLVQTLQ
jgi:hypothetical protein